MTGKLGKVALMKFATPLAKNILPQLATGARSSVIDNFERKTRGNWAGTGAVRVEKGFTLFSLNEDMKNIIRITKSLEKSGLLIDGAAETVKLGIKKQEGRFLGASIAPMTASLIAAMVC